MTSFPRKVFQGEDFEKPLDVLGMNVIAPVKFNVC